MPFNASVMRIILITWKKNPSTDFSTVSPGQHWWFVPLRLCSHCEPSASFRFLLRSGFFFLYCCSHCCFKCGQYQISSVDRSWFWTDPHVQKNDMNSVARFSQQNLPNCFSKQVQNLPNCVLGRGGGVNIALVGSLQPTKLKNNPLQQWKSSPIPLEKIIIWEHLRSAPPYDNNVNKKNQNWALRLAVWT